jgi:hypothetical protein
VRSKSRLAFLSPVVGGRPQGTPLSAMAEAVSPPGAGETHSREGPASAAPSQGPGSAGTSSSEYESFLAQRIDELEAELCDALEAAEESAAEAASLRSGRRRRDRGTAQHILQSRQR